MVWDSEESERDTIALRLYIAPYMPKMLDNNVCRLHEVHRAAVVSPSLVGYRFSCNPASGFCGTFPAPLLSADEFPPL